MGRKRRKKRPGGALVWPVIIMALLAAGVYYIVDYINYPSSAIYKEYGIRLPKNYTIHGIDVSRYQESISWDDVKKMKVENVQVGFAFIKATEGINKVDQQFRRNWNQAKKHGVPRGAYHYLLVNNASKPQAENYIQTVPLQKGDLPPVLDVEDAYGLDPKLLQQRVAEWLLLLQRKYKVKPIIYTNVDFYEKYLAGRFEDYPLWIAHYIHKEAPRISRPWIFWQHSESGRVNGIDANVDFNVFNGDSAAFRKMLIQ